MGVPSSDQLLAMHASFPTSVSAFQKSTVLGWLVLLFTGTSECKHGGPWRTLWSTGANGLIWQSQTLGSFKTMAYIMAHVKGERLQQFTFSHGLIRPMFQVSHCNTLCAVSKVTWANPEQMACNDKRDESAPNGMFPTGILHQLSTQTQHVIVVQQDTMSDRRKSCEQWRASARHFSKKKNAATALRCHTTHLSAQNNFLDNGVECPKW